jgi:hypothetical protein
LLFLTCDDKVLKQRWCKKNETEEVPEDQLDSFKIDAKANKERKNFLTG